VWLAGNAEGFATTKNSNGESQDDMRAINMVVWQGREEWMRAGGRDITRGSRGLGTGRAATGTPSGPGQVSVMHGAWPVRLALDSSGSGANFGLFDAILRRRQRRQVISSAFVPSLPRSLALRRPRCLPSCCN
jgi:hypothetical protein